MIFLLELQGLMLDSEGVIGILMFIWRNQIVGSFKMFSVRYLLKRSFERTFIVDTRKNKGVFEQKKKKLILHILVIFGEIK